MSNPPYGAGQEAFVNSIREAVKKEGKSFFNGKDWRCLSPKFTSVNNTTRKLSIHSFCVKFIAMWIPHLLVDDFVPSCPKCKKADSVDVNKFDWIKNPIVLFGIDSHRYLDTVYYTCNRCNNSQFAGYHKGSMHIDQCHYFGHFNFFLETNMQLMTHSTVILLTSQPPTRHSQLLNLLQT